MKRIAIFASGNGSNAERIVRYFKPDNSVEVSLVLTNNPKAGVIERANRLGVNCRVFNRHILRETNDIVDLLVKEKIDLVVLAGFLWLIPRNILEAFPNRIINIHPALLPKYGGKGMYGHHVHEAVINAGEKVSGITIHFVNERYDEGQIILQKEVDILDSDTPDSLAGKIHQLEYEYFPKVIEDLISDS
jgi:phosphoribosylglycinamide formyltransferase-1